MRRAVQRVTDLEAASRGRSNEAEGVSDGSAGRAELAQLEERQAAEMEAELRVLQAEISALANALQSEGDALLSGEERERALQVRLSLSMLFEIVRTYYLSASSTGILVLLSSMLGASLITTCLGLLSRRN
jgi:hypothetical protein